MKQQSPNERPCGTTERLTVLVLSPLDEDHSALKAIIGHPTYSTWVSYNARDLVSAVALLQQHEIGVVVCEQELQPGTWIDVLKHLNTLSNPPSLIVTSKLADWYLWAKALRLGAWDVLFKPFDLTELIRSVQSASQHWQDQRYMRPKTARVMSAGS
jgi:DNA-binding NtrC family response regulator